MWKATAPSSNRRETYSLRFSILMNIYIFFRGLRKDDLLGSSMEKTYLMGCKSQWKSVRFLQFIFLHFSKIKWIINYIFGHLGSHQGATYTFFESGKLESIPFSVCPNRTRHKNINSRRNVQQMKNGTHCYFLIHTLDLEHKYNSKSQNPTQCHISKMTTYASLLICNCATNCATKTPKTS